MKLSLNGVAREIDDDTTVDEVVRVVAPAATRGIAVAVNAVVVSRSEWPATVLRDGDSVEILTAVQGG